MFHSVIREPCSLTVYNRCKDEENHYICHVISTTILGCDDVIRAAVMWRGWVGSLGLGSGDCTCDWLWQWSRPRRYFYWQQIHVNISGTIHAVYQCVCCMCAHVHEHVCVCKINYHKTQATLYNCCPGVRVTPGLQHPRKCCCPRAKPEGNNTSEGVAIPGVTLTPGQQLYIVITNNRSSCCIPERKDYFSVKIITLLSGITLTNTWLHPYWAYQVK